jgi:hypothetical protein
MGRTVTLELPGPLAERIAAAATGTNRPVEQVVIDWLDRFAGELPMDLLTDEEVLAVADSQMSDAESDELSDLQADAAEGRLTPDRRARLDAVMKDYGRRQLRKADALVEAVRRGLRPRGPYGRA